MKSELFVGIDVSGKGNDWTTVSCLKPSGELILCERLPHSDYKTQIAQLTPITDGPRFTPRKIMVDSTGLGGPWLAMLRDKSINTDINGVTITAGTKARMVEPGQYNVSKKYLMSVLRQAVNNGWLKVRCENENELRKELSDFTAKSSGKLEASTGHDDLVLSLAIALFGLVAETELK